MASWNRSAFFVGLATFFSLLCAGAPPRWTVIDLHNLPDREVRAMARDRQGNRWFGTDKGLAFLSYNGRWATYVASESKGGIRSDSITCLAVDGFGNIWAGTRNGGVNVFEYGAWRNYYPGNTPELPDNAITALAAGQNNTMWVGTSKGFASYKGSAWRSYSWDKVAGNMPTRRVTALAANGNGDVWIGTPAGLARLRGFEWTKYTRENTKGGLPHNFITGLSVSPSGAIWIGTARGLARLTRDTCRIISPEGYPQPLPEFRIHAIQVEKQGDGVWVAFQGGAGHWRDGVWTWFARGAAQDAPVSLHVYSILTEENGQTWFGTRKGLVQYIP